MTPHKKKGNVVNNSADTQKQEKQITLTETELHDILEENIQEIITTIETKEQFSGPVPHPNHMREYKIIDKTLPDRFAAMAEKNQMHRMWVEKAVVLGEAYLGG